MDSKEAEVVEKKFVPRDGSTSLITYSNASNFAVFSHVQNFVLQNQLCEMFNTRLPNHPMKKQRKMKQKKRQRKGNNSLSKVENKNLYLLKMEGVIFSVVYIYIYRWLVWEYVVCLKLSVRHGIVILNCVSRHYNPFWTYYKVKLPLA